MCKRKPGFRSSLVLLLALLAAAAALSCRPATPADPVPPPRVVSFSPAITGLLFDMGLGDHVVGVTTYCRLPAGQKRPVVGDRLAVNAESILAVRPDLLLVQQDLKDFQALRKLRPNLPIEALTIETLSDIPTAMVRLGQLVNAPSAGVAAATTFNTKLQALRQRVEPLTHPRVLFVIGYESPGTGGRNSFIHDMIVAAGGDDVAVGYERWASLGLEDMLKLNPDVLICWVNPGQESLARERWQRYSALPAVRNGRVFVRSEPTWTIPGAHSADLACQLAEMIHQPSGPGAP